MFFPVSSFAMYDSILSEASFCCLPMVLSIASSPGGFTQEGRLFHKKIYQISRQFWRGCVMINTWNIWVLRKLKICYKPLCFYKALTHRSIWKRQILHFKQCVTIKKNQFKRKKPKNTTNPKPKSSTPEFIPCAQSQIQQNITHAQRVLTYLRNEGMQ